MFVTLCGAMLAGVAEGLTVGKLLMLWGLVSLVSVALINMIILTSTTIGRLARRQRNPSILVLDRA